jgi:hypothetical protein
MSTLAALLQQSPTPSAFPDWASAYSTLESQTQLPGIAYQNTAGDAWVVRDMVVNLQAVCDSIASATPAPVSVSVYADVVQAPANYSTTLANVGLVIVTRRVEIPGTAQITLAFNTAPDTVLAIYANEIAGTLNVNAPTAAQPDAQFPLTSMPSLGLAFTSAQGAPAMTQVSFLPQELLADGSDFALSLVSIYQFATVLFSQIPQVSTATGPQAFGSEQIPIVGSMLQWIRNATASAASSATTTAALFLDSSALLAMLQNINATSAFVPYLNQSIYAGQMSAYVTAAIQYQTQYQTFADASQNIQARIAAAQVLAGNNQDQQNYFGQLISQMQQNVANTQAGVSAASTKVQLQLITVGEAKLTLEAGIAEWEYEQNLEAAWNIIVSIGTFAAAIPAMLVGDEAAAAPAAAQAGNFLQTLSTAMKTIAKVADLMKAVYEATKAIVEASVSISSAGSLSSQLNGIANTTLQLPDGSDPMGDASWEIFKEQVQTYLQQAMSMNIPGAAQYQDALLTLAIYAEAQLAAEQSLVQTSQGYARLLMQAQVGKSQQDRLQQYIAKMSASEQPNTDMMQILYQRVLDAKRPFFTASVNYSWSYQYWALQNAGLPISMVQSVQDMSAGLAALTSAYANALNNFPSQPINFSSLSKTITDPVSLQDIQLKRTTTINIDLTDATFAGKDRVRLTAARAWLTGARSAVSGTSVYVQITNSGQYEDRLVPQDFSFVARPLAFAFQYDLATQKIEIDGQIGTGEAGMYYQPTPFTAWTLTVPGPSNPGFDPNLDFSQLSGITLEFAGELIPESLGR